MAGSAVADGMAADMGEGSSRGVTPVEVELSGEE